MESPEIHTHTYCHLSSDNLASIYSGERSLFNKWCGEHKTVTCKIVKSDHCPIACCCSSSLTQSCPTLWDSMDCSTPGVPDLHQLPEPAQTHLHWASDVIQPSCPLSSSSSALNLSLNQGLFLWVSSSHQVAKVLELQLQQQSFQFRLDFHRTDLFDLLEVQGILKSLLQDHSSKVSILWCSAFLMVQLSHLHMTAGKTISLIRWIFVSNVSAF